MTSRRSLPPFLLFGFVLASFSLSAQVGIVEFIDGEVSLTRSGTVLPSLDIGDPIENFDLIKTGASGQVIIALDKRTGMGGTLAVKPKSVFSVKSEVLAGSPATEADMLAGSISVKAQKIAGSPSLRIRTTNTVMGIRGTQFDVVLSINDSLLVGCSEGRVVCEDEEGRELEAVPGQTVARSAGERMRRVPVAVSNLETFKNQWIAEEIDVFMASPLRAIDQYAALYRRMKADFDRAFAPLARDESLAVWASEHRRGVVPRANDIAVMRQKSSVVPKLMAVRRVLFLFERVYYRLEDIREQVGAGALRNDRLSSGGTVFEFFREFSADKADLERRTAAYRFALRLFAERNEGRDVVSEGGDAGFFDDTSSFFN